MTRKVIIDCDMGTDDAVAISMALFDSRLEVLALTATEGCVSADQATRNMQVILDVLDPPKYPRIGAAKPCDDAPADNTTFLYGSDGLGNSDFNVAELKHILDAEKLISDCVRANPNDVTVVCLGPLTNIARAFRRDPTIADLIHRLVIVGGSVDGIGNITPAAEFNFYFDPISAQEVLESRTAKTLIPLNITRQVQFDLDFLHQLPDEDTRIGSFLRQILPFAYRAYRQQLAAESITLNDAVGLVSLLEPRLFEFEPMAGQVEIAGQLTRGVTVFDRRSFREWRENLEVACSIEHNAVRQCVLDQLGLAARC
ncbi:MAG TPA: nucleoside hydrolase [Pirellulaceae bacterium]|nr:nucleoside hydrolase [Pirellulaceae bacterium]HMO93042.1 nucleoside hydrolase [Pirellulaceae bacterium]HMP69672.1 nucleoside hydrolase [Pirellulaceae bacterium]